MKTLEHEAEAIRVEEVRMATRRRHLENHAARIRDYVIDSMQKTNTKSVESPLFRVTCAQGPASVKIIDEKLIPECYYVTKRELSLANLKAEMKVNGPVPGAELVRKPMLRIS